MQLETPPRAWGRPPMRDFILEVMGNTPTCMGKTLSMLLLLLTMGKHPHVHGEDIYIDAPESNGRETPPRAWGRLQQRPLKGSNPGNTPTCMGKTPGRG